MLNCSTVVILALSSFCPHFVGENACCSTNVMEEAFSCIDIISYEVNTLQHIKV